MRYPLEKLKIIDFTYLLPGPYGTMMLADMGADIIKVENLNNPDLMRIVPPHIDGLSAAYAQINRGKKSLALDLRQEEAREVIRKLVREYDIVLEQFRPGVMDKLGLGYETLAKLNPSVIYCSLTGYGQTGSYASRAGHDINYLALSGIESYSGRKAHGPSLDGIQIADIAGGSKNLVIAVLAAWIRRAGTGEGDYVDISITDSAFSLTAFQTSRYLMGGPMPEAETDFLNGGAIYDFYGTSDGRYLSVGPIEPKFFVNFCRAVGFPEIAEKSFSTQEELEEAKKLIAEKIASEPLDRWCAVFREADACAEPVYTLGEAMARPPLSEREMIVAVSGEQGASFKQVSGPFKFRSGNYVAPHAGVGLGRHNREILASLGYSDEDVEKMKEAGGIP